MLPAEFTGRGLQSDPFLIYIERFPLNAPKHTAPSQRLSLCECCFVMSLQVGSDSQSGSLYDGHLEEVKEDGGCPEARLACGSKTPLLPLR